MVFQFNPSARRSVTSVSIQLLARSLAVFAVFAATLVNSASGAPHFAFVDEITTLFDLRAMRPNPIIDEAPMLAPWIATLSADERRAEVAVSPTNPPRAL